MLSSHIDLSCANPCLSQANILPNTTSDLDNIGKNEKGSSHGLVANSSKKKSNKRKYKEQSQNKINISLTCINCNKEGSPCERLLFEERREGYEQEAR
jgi:hypothetical protein